MVKDKKIMERWLRKSYEKAREKGFKRMPNLDFILDYWMSPQCVVTTSAADWRRVQNAMVEMFMDFEKICQLIEEGKLRESNVRLAHEAIVW